MQQLEWASYLDFRTPHVGTIKYAKMEFYQPFHHPSPLSSVLSNVVR